MAIIHSGKLNNPINAHWLIDSELNKLTIWIGNSNKILIIDYSINLSDSQTMSNKC